MESGSESVRQAEYIMHSSSEEEEDESEYSDDDEELSIEMAEYDQAADGQVEPREGGDSGPESYEEASQPGSEEAAISNGHSAAEEMEQE